MENMGTYKCVFSNEAGSDETAGKVTIKPVRTTDIYNIFFDDSILFKSVEESFVKNRKV